MSILPIIESKVREALSPTHLELRNESHLHRGPRDAETHFKLIVVSEHFDGMRLIQRHRLIHELLKNEMVHPIHALAISAYTNAEWLERAQQAPQTPNCRGGDLANT
ncbi:DNA-binding transcriptional regulator BolA [Vibrio stylophorae]|uniref:DNA-binding transcriptional regulator BolA n=1 Tax=Vibrio stylophorae TaxID=659351 RepID=A0ABM8ZRM3_9VIBR|nr:BolA family protein [Vibrio stylophorae]CAH0532952.1 DNA-binding transcriptional regulator BolA [Vibrio stylophorae]